MARSPVPGEARVRRVFGGLLAVSNGSLIASEETRRGTQRNMIVGGRITLMDRHRLSSIQIGSARAYDVDRLVGDALPQFILIGMSFIGKFTTTLDLDGGRVLFRPGLPP